MLAALVAFFIVPLIKEDYVRLREDAQLDAPNSNHKLISGIFFAASTLLADTK